MCAKNLPTYSSSDRQVRMRLAHLIMSALHLLAAIMHLA
jgi:hypothetical protein